ncbi:hypothetical protein SLS55_010192 [Diplodia seriata]|uniref:BZIP domain-containing protein n=1 Tax=Diplodia seriata TaxID=420778 RepID=A0ABR3BXV0_9PEZI
MASIVGASNISLPPSEAFRPEFDDGADPTLLSDPFAGIFDEVFFSKPSNPPPVGPGEGFAAQLNGQDAGIPADDSARRDSGCILSPYHLDDDPLLKTTASPADATTSPETTTTTTTTTSCDPGQHQPSDQPPPPDSASNARKRPYTGNPNTKRQQRRRYPSPPRSSANDTPSARARREANLEKNRTAATRCREKRKTWTARLEDRHRQLSGQNRLLRAELAGLHDAVYGLKELVLRHADCGFRPVDEYVAREAERVRDRARGGGGRSSAEGLPES